MFPIVFDVELEGIMTVHDERRFNKLFKQALKAMLFRWFVKFFDLHFQRTAFQRYPGVYKKRRRRRRVKAGKRHGEAARRRPNVLTGRMKRELEQSFKVTGTLKVMTATMKGPKYTDVDGKNQPDKASEITFISAPERENLARFMETALAQLIRKVKVKKRKRIAG